MHYIIGINHEIGNCVHYSTVVSGCHDYNEGLYAAEQAYWTTAFCTAVACYSLVESQAYRGSVDSRGYASLSPNRNIGLRLCQ